MEQLAISRKLDPGERFFWMLDQLSGMNFVVFAEISGALDTVHLQKALQLAQHAHPLLRVKITQEKNDTLRFEPVAAPLTLEQITVSRHDWQKPIEQELVRPFTLEDAPLMRARYLQLVDEGGNVTRSVLALTFHHAIADGRSGTTLLRDILNYLARPELDSHFRTGAIHPPMHDAFPERYDWQRHPDAALDLVALKKTDIKRYGRPASLPWLDQLQTRRMPRFERIKFDVDQTAQLIRRCKSNGVTMHGALGAAQLLAKHKSTADDGALTLSLSSPADMRPHLSSAIPATSLGLYVTILASTYQVGADRSFWELAREVGADIKRQIGRGDGHLLFAQIKPDMFALNKDGMDEFSRIMLSTPQGSMISNVGIVDPADAAANVEAISFVLCPMPYQIVFSAVSTYNGRLIVNIAYDAAKLTPENAAQLAQWMQQELLVAD